MKSLDRIDRRILIELQQAADLSMQEVGERVGLSHTPCWRRVKRLEERGLIRRRVALLDAPQLDLAVNVLVNVSLKRHQENALNRFEDAVQDVQVAEPPAREEPPAPPIEPREAPPSPPATGGPDIVVEPDKPDVMIEPDGEVLPECGPGTELGPSGECVVARTEAPEGQNGCLVATAAYGTELAPAVQKLREVRDGTLQGTAAGSAFMSAFNAAYYAFSPAVADLERQSPVFRDAVRAAVTPMIYSLQVMDSASSEGEVAFYGLAVIALNLAMYAGIPVAVIAYARRRAR